MKGDLFMTRDKVISKVLSIIRIVVLLFIIAYFYKYLITLEQETLNSVLIIVFLINMIKFLIEIERREKK